MADAGNNADVLARLGTDAQAWTDEFLGDYPLGASIVLFGNVFM